VVCRGAPRHALHRAAGVGAVDALDVHDGVTHQQRHDHRGGRPIAEVHEVGPQALQQGHPVQVPLGQAHELRAEAVARRGRVLLDELGGDEAAEQPMDRGQREPRALGEIAQLLQGGALAQQVEQHRGVADRPQRAAGRLRLRHGPSLRRAAQRSADRKALTPNGKGLRGKALTSE
jgi:hypothetical protein